MSKSLLVPALFMGLATLLPVQADAQTLLVAVAVDDPDGHAPGADAALRGALAGHGHVLVPPGAIVAARAMSAETQLGPEALESGVLLAELGADLLFVLRIRSADGAVALRVRAVGSDASPLFVLGTAADPLGELLRQAPAWLAAVGATRLGRGRSTPASPSTTDGNGAPLALDAAAPASAQFAPSGSADDQFAASTSAGDQSAFVAAGSRSDQTALAATASPLPSGPPPVGLGAPSETHLATGVAGGAHMLNSLGGDCRGFASEVPSHVVQVTAGTSRLSFIVNADHDTTLAVRTADGRIHCADDSDGLQPRLDLPVVPGETSIWVGSYSSSRTGPYRLAVTLRSELTRRDFPMTEGQLSVDTSDSGFFWHFSVQGALVWFPGAGRVDGAITFRGFTAIAFDDNGWGVGGAVLVSTPTFDLGLDGYVSGGAGVTVDQGYLIVGGSSIGNGAVFVGMGGLASVGSWVTVSTELSVYVSPSGGSPTVIFGLGIGAGRPAH